MKRSGNRLNIDANGWDFVEDKMFKKHGWGRVKPKTNRAYRKSTRRYLKKEMMSMIDNY